MEELTSLEELAKSVPAQDVDELFDILIEGIKSVPKCLQIMIDSVCNMQDSYPMPAEGWDKFVKDVEYTNLKHGFNLQVTRYRNDE